MTLCLCLLTGHEIIADTHENLHRLTKNSLGTSLATFLKKSLLSMTLTPPLPPTMATLQLNLLKELSIGTASTFLLPVFSSVHSNLHHNTCTAQKLHEDSDPACFSHHCGPSSKDSAEQVVGSQQVFVKEMVTAMEY